MGVVVDSSIFIAAERGRFNWVGFHTQVGAEPLFLTAVTLAELLHGAERADSPARREKRLAFIANAESRYPLLVFGRDEAAAYAALWAAMAASGIGIGAHDLQIAAIAHCHGHHVATLNGAEFARVPGITVLDATPFAARR